MFKLAVQSTPAKVARIPHIPMLEEHNVRSGFFSHEEYLAVRAGLPDYAQVAVSIAYYTGLRIGEVLGLKWSQVDLGEGKLSLTPLQTKTETSRVVYLPPDLHRVLLEAKRRHEASYPASPWVCQRHGERLLEIKRCWKRACRRMGLEGRLVHDFRRTAVRNMTRAGIPEKVAMAISGHKTRSVFDRYNIVNETDLKGAAKALATYYEQEKVTLSVTVAELVDSGAIRPIVNQLKVQGDMWSRRSGLNGRPAVYETAALPTELRRPLRKTSQLTWVFSQPQGVFRATTDEKRDFPRPTLWLTDQLSGNNGPLFELSDWL